VIGLRGRLGSKLASWLFLGAHVACASKPPLGTLFEKRGDVERDFASRLQQWQTAEVGAELQMGDGLQTLTDATALLTLDDGSRLSLEPNTVVRFANTPPGPHVLDLEVEVGSASLLVDRDALSLRSAGGRARLQPRSRILLAPSSVGLRFVVQVGQAVLGDDEVLGAGQGIVVDGHGKAVSNLETDRALAAIGGKSVRPSTPDAEPGQLEGKVRANVSGKRASIKGDGGWHELPEGPAQLPQGAEIEIGKGTTVLLERGDERATLHENGRYVVAPAPDVLVAASAGSLSARDSGRVRVEVPGGVIVIAAEGKARIRLRARDTEVEVESEQAIVDTGAKQQVVAAGSRAVLDRDGNIQLEAPQTEGRGLGYADMEVAAGESLTIHDPRPPTAVRFAFDGACPEAGRLQLYAGSGRKAEFAAGSDAVSLALKAGTYRYDLRCIGEQGRPARGKPERKGRLTVFSDSGTRAAPVRAPSTTLQADGRKYSVLYQNRLPAITFAWPEAPARGDLTLVHEFGKQRSTLPLGEPQHTFASGELKEGKHALHFARGGKVSRQTTLSIEFDNAAPTASINTPTSLELVPGASLTISGTALPGWDVSVEGKPASCDAQGRFSVESSVPNERRAIAVRLSRPGRGTHVYLRRGSP